MGRKKKRLRLLARLAKKAAPAPTPAKPVAALKAKPAPAPKAEPKVEEPKVEEKHECDEDPCTHEEKE